MTIQELQKTYATAYKNGRMLTPQEFNQMLELIVLSNKEKIEESTDKKQFEKVATDLSVVNNSNTIIINLNKRVEAIESFLEKATKV